MSWQRLQNAYRREGPDLALGAGGSKPLLAILLPCHKPIPLVDRSTSHSFQVLCLQAETGIWRVGLWKWRLIVSINHQRTD
jgi:hypothetical protein